MAGTGEERWPKVPVASWQDSRDTLQLYTQVVGKVRLANEPTTNHWWDVPLYVTARGLTTSLTPHPTGPSFQIDFDFVTQHLHIATVHGAGRRVPLVARTVAEFYHFVMDVRWTWPPRGSPVGPLHPTEEVRRTAARTSCSRPTATRSAAAGTGRACRVRKAPFYSYAHPWPPAFREAPVEPNGATWDDDLAEFVLPYEQVRTAAQPDAVLLAFLQSSYEPAAMTARRDRAGLERAGDGRLEL